MAAVTRMVWEVLVEPFRGSGFLEEGDIEQALVGVPDGAVLELVLTEFDHFSASAASYLARRTVHLSVGFRVRPSARRAGADFVQLFLRYQDQYLSLEASALRGRSA